MRFSAFVSTEDIEEGSGAIWMRVDDYGRRSSAFDNMRDRPLTGTADWTRHPGVLDVSDEAQGIFFGAFLHGRGRLWIKDLTFESVGKDVPTTGQKKPTEPGNLELER